MKLCLTISFLIAALGGATEVESNDPPSLEGLNPTQIEKILIEDILDKPKGKKGKGSKAPVKFEDTVKPILKQFKKQLLDEKKKMQAQLYSDIATIKKCITKMQKSVKLGLLETEKKKCPSKKDVKKCKDKLKKVKPVQEACKELKLEGGKDVKNIQALMKKWNKQKVSKNNCKLGKGESKYHWVSRLAGHFKKKLAALKARLREKIRKQRGGKKLDKKCDAIKHYAQHLVKVTCRKIKDANYACQCARVIQEKKVCNMYDGCYAASVLQYKNNKKEIMVKNAAAKLEWRAVGRIECLLKVMSGKNKADAKQLNKCINGKQISTKPLDLNYPKEPPKPKCQMKGLDVATRKNCAKGDQGKKPKKR